MNPLLIIGACICLYFAWWVWEVRAADIAMDEAQKAGE
jgi:hypothetical protein